MAQILIVVRQTKKAEEIYVDLLIVESVVGSESPAGDLLAGLPTLSSKPWCGIYELEYWTVEDL